MRIVVDTNIVFSSILNTESNIADLLLDESTLEFFAPNFILTELNEHSEKLIKILKLRSKDDLNELIYLVTKHIKFIDESEIKKENWMNASELTLGIDPDDTVFVALAEHLKAELWTGDKHLISGLKKKGFSNVVNTRELLKLKRK